MPLRMLIDAAHREETRVAVVRGNQVEEFDLETTAKKRLKGNIYLAKITRVEPSLQAAFVDYGGNRHGFLAFSEIHPDYYRIPTEDRQALIRQEAEEEAKANAESEAQSGEAGGTDGDDDGPPVESLGADDDIDEVIHSKRRFARRYNIQEVIAKRQVLLIQVVKEERGTKGAALTTYLSLAGRYCVLMPNSPRGGGISRKIASAADRKKLKSVLADLSLAEGMGAIIRTAGSKRTKAEIKRDFKAQMEQWESICDLTVKSTAPTLIHEEGNLVKRAIRDLYVRDIEEILVEGEDGYRVAKDYMRTLTPSHAKKVICYRDKIPLFHRYKVEAQLDSMYDPTIQLKSGGYIVINMTEALVAIDVNSGRSTREASIERTALKTNLEAADEVARQLRLRDLAGLVVIDFIDMEENKNNRAVERRIKERLRTDRARLQVGRISHFGLMEMSRQRLRRGLLESSTTVCPSCRGAGILRAIGSASLQVLRAIEEEGVRGRGNRVAARAAASVAAYLLNEKRRELREIEERFGLTIHITADPDLAPGYFEIDQQSGADSAGQQPKPQRPGGAKPDVKDSEDTAGRPARRRRRGGRGRKAETPDDGDQAAVAEVKTDGQGSEFDDAAAEKPDRPKRRRGRRGGRRRRGGAKADAPGATEITAETTVETTAEAGAEAAPISPTGSEPIADAPAPSEVPVEAVHEPVENVETKAAVRKPRPRRKSAGTGDSATPPQGEAVATPVEDIPANDAPTSDGPTTDASAKDVAEAPAKPRRRRAAAKPKAEAKVKAKAKPKAKARAKKSKADTPAATEPGEDADAAAPRKRRTRKAAQPKADSPSKPRPKAASKAEPAPQAEPAAEPKPDAPAAPARRGWWQRKVL